MSDQPSSLPQWHETALVDKGRTADVVYVNFSKTWHSLPQYPHNVHIEYTYVYFSTY